MQVMFSIVNNPQFNRSFLKILSASLAPKTMLALKKAAKKIEEESRLYEATRKDICHEACNKNDKGEPLMKKIIDKSGKETEVFDIPPEKLPEVEKKIADLQTAKLQVGRKFKLSELEGANLSTVDLLALEEFIEEESE